MRSVPPPPLATAVGTTPGGSDIGTGEVLQGSGWFSLPHVSGPVTVPSPSWPWSLKPQLYSWVGVEALAGAAAPVPEGVACAVPANSSREIAPSNANTVTAQILSKEVKGLITAAS